MHFHFSFYSSLLLIFFTQGLLFSFLLGYKAFVQHNRALYWLSAFVFLCSLYLLPWMLGHAGWYSLQPYRDVMLYFPFQHLFLIGPVLFCYTRCLLNPGYRFAASDWVHFILPALYLLYSVVMFVADKLVLQRYYFYGDGRDRELDLWYGVSGMASMAVYLLLSIRYYRRYRRLLVQVVSFADGFLFRWVQQYLFAFLLMVVANMLLLLLYPQWGSFTTKWWYYFIFSILNFFIALKAFATPVTALIPFRLLHTGRTLSYLVTEPQQQPPKKILLLPQSQTFNWEEPAATDSTDTTVDYECEKEKILKVVVTEQGFKDPELTLAILAKQTNLSPNLLSRIINKGFGANFNDFINQHRVAAVQTLLQQGEDKQQTLLGIAYDCGFNSKNTFNRAFRKHAGCSPKEYISQLPEINNRN